MKFFFGRGWGVGIKDTLVIAIEFTYLHRRIETGDEIHVPEFEKYLIYTEKKF